MAEMVADSILHWQEMEGETELLRKLNALLTSHFVWRKGVPADECVTEASELFRIWLASQDTRWKVQGQKYLESRFAEDESGRLISDACSASCKSAVERADALFRGGQWPDRPVSV